MPKFSQRSIDALSTCHVDLQVLCLRVIQFIDFTVLEGFRSDEDQLEAMFQGKSRVGPESSLHCQKPSLAVDIAPYRKNKPHIDWGGTSSFAYLAGWMMATAQAMGIPLRWGGDWDGDGETADNRFDDLGHFELRR